MLLFVVDGRRSLSCRDEALNTKGQLQFNKKLKSRKGRERGPQRQIRRTPVDDGGRLMLVERRRSVFLFRPCEAKVRTRFARGDAGSELSDARTEGVPGRVLSRSRQRQRSQRAPSKKHGQQRDRTAEEKGVREDTRSSSTRAAADTLSLYAVRAKIQRITPASAVLARYWCLNYQYSQFHGTADEMINQLAMRSSLRLRQAINLFSFQTNSSYSYYGMKPAACAAGASRSPSIFIMTRFSAAWSSVAADVINIGSLLVVALINPSSPHSVLVVHTDVLYTG
ncbi:hypothetical protein T310_2004 [Rasamsonia emersonii CBS 393.64]|uniref:Uncharacterized protein n=1 Tax=Rasamsonia emersonii (strain ATCC 16479 / CBS 393.64 / IMI 116815) TaxID=1408163 RepID=A0A0F4Z265_RASE3|nr:hypothetical protein T310_2004 [Rasamsonia emersonii CBS 393.64]KKA23963.1 hypothetical protein T310_2004 [Rasamsonia emersonii CBS 393.64]